MQYKHAWLEISESLAGSFVFRKFSFVLFLFEMISLSRPSEQRSISHRADAPECLNDKWCLIRKRMPRVRLKNKRYAPAISRLRFQFSVISFRVVIWLAVRSVFSIYEMRVAATHRTHIAERTSSLIFTENERAKSGSMNRRRKGECTNDPIKGDKKCNS